MLHNPSNPSIQGLDCDAATARFLRNHVHCPRREAVQGVPPWAPTVRAVGVYWQYGSSIVPTIFPGELRDVDPRMLQYFHTSEHRNITNHPIYYST